MDFWKAVTSFLLVAVVFALSPKLVLAQVVINEFMANPDSGNEWVEFYNSSSETINLADYYFDDDNNFDDDSGSSSKVQLSGQLEAGNLCFVELSSFLNNSGDSPTIMKYDKSVTDAYSYSYTIKGKTYSRIPDGGDWQVNQDPTKTAAICTDLAPTNTPSPSPSPTPTNTPTQEATCVVNKPNDSEGNSVNNAKIYIDGAYTGNYAEETYKFCPGCTCGANDVACDFGNHTISLERSGYDSWSQTIDIISGDNLSLDPLMTLLVESDTTNTPTPTKLPTKSITKSADDSNFLVDLDNPETTSGPIELNPLVLGEKTDDVDVSDSLATNPESSGERKKDFPVGPTLFMLGGFTFIGAASYPFLKGKNVFRTLKDKREKVYNPRGDEG